MWRKRRRNASKKLPKWTNGESDIERQKGMQVIINKRKWDIKRNKQRERHRIEK